MGTAEERALQLQLHDLFPSRPKKGGHVIDDCEKAAAAILGGLAASGWQLTAPLDVGRCTMTSSVTNTQCLLPLHHSADSVYRYHRFEAPTRETLGRRDKHG